ncbi:MAG: NUDIX domain-containing protein [Candidatus Nitronauta litoralis]|uniref:NUDIX domain-containing protein n=1 Tax=Candidatus Nitronauta litoralis TaxID=2705533 RepID=A0A7T0G1F5_9BACT|nr:MAG: NUDIX domain-containing protein [Candidatus Nitronauta litoralis]
MHESEEIFDVVDQDDQVIGQATRKEVHERGLRHRSVHILVFNSKGELFLQKRSLAKDENPGYWDTSAAGHVDSGEDYESCAHRELEEELGIKADLKEIGKFSACSETFFEHVRVYLCTSDANIVINPDEISEGRFWSLNEIETSLQDETLPFTSTFRLILDKLRGSLR